MASFDTVATGKRVARSPHEELRRFLLGVAALVAIAVIVGGGTRLTESGLSITEWNVVSGVLPPLDTAAWLGEFDKYRHTIQYQELNQAMTLEDFKIIYLWEWAHRIIGRVIGGAFIAGFLWHLWHRTYRVSDPLFRRLLGIGLLIGLQGAVGWWMVRSGLFDRVNVAPYRLAIHLTLACAIFALLFSTALRLKEKRALPSLRADPWAIGVVALVFLQIFLGALVAGNRAGYAFETWPLMDDRFVPPTLFELEPWWRNLFENAAFVQFAHRMTAYALTALAFLNLFRRNGAAKPTAAGLALAVTVQASLGVATLLSGVHILVALAHQAGLLVVVMMALRHLHAASSPPPV